MLPAGRDFCEWQLHFCEIRMFTLAMVVSLVSVCLAFPQKPEESAADVSGITCGYSTCGKNSVCDKSDGYEQCVCNPGFYGSPYGVDAGCTSEPQCVDDTGCDEDKFCNFSNLCENPCIFKCVDVGCKVKNHVAECVYDGHLFWEPYNQTTPN